MPGLNGTGPSGMGPMTGWGQGYCNPSRTAYGPAPAWGPEYWGSAYGRGFGHGFVRGRGLGRGFWPGAGRGRGYARGSQRGAYPTWRGW